MYLSDYKDQFAQEIFIFNQSTNQKFIDLFIIKHHIFFLEFTFLNNYKHVDTCKTI